MTDSRSRTEVVVRDALLYLAGTVFTFGSLGLWARYCEYVKHGRRAARPA